MEQLAAIVPAGGCGEIGNGSPKILEELPNGKSILGQVLNTLIQSGVKETIVVVNNYKFQLRIESHLEKEGFTGFINFAHQHWRLGAAEAVAIGLEKLSLTTKHILVNYADMPLWRSETIQQLMELHIKEQAAISLVSIRLNESSPEILKKYGRILEDEQGQIVDIIEPHEPLSIDPRLVVRVNPSLYVFDRGWLKINLCRIEPAPRNDGFPAEFYIPPLIKIAHEIGDKVARMALQDHNEALGVNNLEQLEEVRRVFQNRANP